MATVITVINQKGGVGKSTTAHSLGMGLARKRKKVLFIDLDAQANLTTTLKANNAERPILDVLTNQCGIKDAIHHIEKVDILTACSSLALADSILKETGREFCLKECIEPVLPEYDYIVIDTPPALGVLTVNALTASNYAIIPALADVFSIHGVNQLAETITRVKKYCNPSLSIAGIVLTRFSSRTVLSRDIKEIMEKVAGNLGTCVFKATIRDSVTVREAQFLGKDLFSYAPKSSVAKDYMEFINEFLNKVKK